MARNVKGSKNPFYGKRHSWDSREAMAEAKRGENNPNFDPDSPGRYPFDEHRAAAFSSGEHNLKWKGTYVLDVANSVQYGPYSKADTLIAFRISSRKYYEYLNTGLVYKGHSYRNERPFDVTKYGDPQ